MYQGVMRDQKQLNARYREAVSHWNIAGHPRIQSTLLMVLYLDHMCQCASVGYTWCPSRTPVHLCTTLLQNLAAEPCCRTLLQNLAVQQDFYSSLGVPLERSC